MPDQEQKDYCWLKDKLIPVPGGWMNCSACIFRNARVYCDKLTCSYTDLDSGLTIFVYWKPANGTYANIGLWQELIEYFGKTSNEETRNLANNMVITVARENLSKIW